MTLEEILQDIHACEETMLTYERKYGVLSETFYQSFMSGEEPGDDAWVLDWVDWAGAYEVYLRRREQYRAALESLKQETPLVGDIIKRTARRESISLPAGDWAEFTTTDWRDRALTAKRENAGHESGGIMFCKETTHGTPGHHYS